MVRPHLDYYSAVKSRYKKVDIELLNKSTEASY